MNSSARTTTILAAVNATVYCGLFVCWLLRDLVPGLTDSVSRWLLLPAPAAEALRYPWTLVSYMFSHLNFLHLAVNMLWLIGFGAMMKGGGRRTLLTYLAGGVLGGISFLLASQGADNSLAGASAAVIAVVVASAMLTPNRRVSLLFIADVKLAWIAPVAVLTMLAGPAPQVAAHLGGVIGGCIAGGLFLMRERSLTSRARQQAILAVEEARRRDYRRSLLSKASQSGFASLSPQEQAELFSLSNRNNS